MPEELEPPKDDDYENDGARKTKRHMLFDAASDGDYANVKKLLEEGVDPYKWINTTGGRVSIRGAVKWKRKEIKREIFLYLKNPSKSDKKYSDLMQSYRNYKKIMKLLPKADSQAWIIR